MTRQDRRGAIVRRGPVIGARRPPVVVRRRIGSGVYVPPAPPPPLWRRLGRGWAFLGVLVLFICVLGGAGFWAYTSSTFRVQEVVVAGAERIPEATIVERSGLL